MSQPVSMESVMTINLVIEQCLEQARAADLSLEKQNAMAVQVLRKMRPEWLDYQIHDTIKWVRGIASTEMTDC